MLVPTLRAWRGSVVVVDVAAGLRHAMTHAGAGSDYCHWTPMDGEGQASFNLLSAIRRGTPHEALDIRALVEELIPEGRRDLELVSLARAIAAFSVAAVLGADAAHLADAHALISVGLRGWLGLTAEQRQQSRAMEAWAGALSEELAFLNGKQDGLRAAMLAESALTPFLGPREGWNATSSSFGIMDLGHSKERVALHVTAGFGNREVAAPIVRAFVRLLSRHTQVEEGQHMLLVVNNLEGWGPVNFLADALPNLTQKGVKVLLVAQSLKGMVDENLAIWEQCTTKAIFRPYDLWEAGNVRREALPSWTAEELVGADPRSVLVVRAGQRPRWVLKRPYYEADQGESSGAGGAPGAAAVDALRGEPAPNDESGACAQ